MRTLLILALCVACPETKVEAAEFHWINKLPDGRTPLLRHGTFESQSNQTEIGYYLYLPPGYDDAANSGKRYPVVYYLHGGRPGGEQKSVNMAPVFDEAIRAGRVPPMIYVFVNGGAMSHYDFPALKSYGETAFVKELIPHIDATYRTIADRSGRGIEGFSQGGRGTGRIMFKHAELFCSAAPMGGGHQHEKHAAEHDGRETSGVQFDPGNNTYDLAREYAKRREQFPLAILVGFGRKDFNYEANLDWVRHLESLGIPCEQAIAGDAPHSALKCYENLGDRVMLFHARNFAAGAEQPTESERRVDPVFVEPSGVRVHRLRSPRQAGETEVLVLPPDEFDSSRRYPVLFILPVEAGRGERWGNGLAEVQAANLHNQFGLICVTPTFSQVPWYADHPTDPRVQQEAYLLHDVLPLVAREYPQARTDRGGRLLLGFSKSGWGAWSLLLRHPELFDTAAAWDAPLMLDAPGKYGSGPIFGTPENFSQYDLQGLLRKRRGEFESEAPRLIHLGSGNFRSEHDEMERLLAELAIPHVYRDGPQREHNWGSGWLPEAVRLLAEHDG